MRVVQRSVNDVVAMRVQKDVRGAGWEETPTTTTPASFIRDGGGISNSGRQPPEAGRRSGRRVEDTRHSGERVGITRNGGRNRCTGMQCTEYTVAQGPTLIRSTRDHIARTEWRALIWISDGQNLIADVLSR